ncbi:MAG: DEAD/DEAH box helicase [Kiritimatiellae bacterium]|nr:DEAD/DEAH box helicase [Kiritimatiellia bacterium]
MKKPGKKTSEAARKVQAKKAARNLFPSDDESVELRRQGAEMQSARVMPLDSGHRFFGAYEVASTQWKEPYRVEIRSLTDTLNTCSCRDHSLNRLGTCKHIERVLQLIERQAPKRALALAREEGSARYEVFMDVREWPPRLSLTRPRRGISKGVEEAIGCFFGADGTVLGQPLEAYHSILRAHEALAPATRRKVNLSQHVGPWMAELERAADLTRAKECYLRDVREGKRSGNPVRLPLYPYQQEGMLHLAFQGRAMLADEMGLGKTVQAIAAAELLRQLGRVQRVLVVCPASLKSEWEEQYHFFTGGRVELLYGPRQVRLRRYAEKPAFLVLNYEQARADVDDINRLFAPDLVILDEAQRIKNWPTKTAKTIKRLSAPYAFVLTGTPLENRIEELYSLAEFVNPHLFGSLFRFQREFMEEGGEGSAVRPKNLNELHRRISGVMLRRRKSDVEQDLPERTDKHYFVPMTDEQRTRYAEVEYRVNILVNIMKTRLLRKEEMEQLQRHLACMRMICDTPYILDAECRDCPKLEELEAILDELLADDDVKVLIFSEWVRMLSLVEELAREKQIGYALHTGTVPQKQRRDEINRFKNDPDCRLFLSSESGGAGLNLQAASVVINLDLPWNPAKLEQRIARAWRKNQQRHVRVINLVAENTIEAAMLQKLADKQALANAVLDGAQLPDVETSARSFAQRVASLMGVDAASEAPARAPSRGKQPATPETTRDYILACFSDRVLSIQREQKNNSLLVVARSTDDARQIRENLSTQTPPLPHPVEIVDAATADLLQRLQQQGLIRFSSGMESFFAAPGCETPESPKKPVYIKQARTHWAIAARAWKAAQALLAADLPEMAQPHLITVARTAIEALVILEEGAVKEINSDSFDVSACGPHADLARDLSQWVHEAKTLPGADSDRLMDLIRTVQKVMET